MKHTIREEIRGVLVFVGIIWAVFILDMLLPGEFTNLGLSPRNLFGLIGIPLAPFLHGDFKHLLSNTIPLVILLTLMAGSRTRTWPTVAEITLLGGSLLWLFGRGGSSEDGRFVHVGASGLVYGLIAFLIVAGFREKRLVPMMVAILVGVLYGGTLLSGVIPSARGNISWDGHLFGALAGAGLAYFTLGKNIDTKQITS
jgi:membrane associated rhomboid family serine protease